MTDPMISSLEEMIWQIREDAANWRYTWFRGEPGGVERPLTPRLYRCDGRKHNENELLQHFRMKAPIFALGHTPNREATDQWLFLAQHVGLPTRLLDWTESPLVALHFALLEIEKEPVRQAQRPVSHPPMVWMLNPIELNRLSVSENEILETEFPLTWLDPRDWPDSVNIGHENIRGAWEKDERGTELPVAVYPTYTHPRMSVQRSCFTVQGKDKNSLAELVGRDILKRYPVNMEMRVELRKGLRLLGIDHATLFPDLDGLARELGERL